MKTNYAILIIFICFNIINIETCNADCEPIERISVYVANGDIEAITENGICYFNIKNYDNAKKYFEVADTQKLPTNANAKQIEAQARASNFLGIMYMRGLGVARNEEKGKKLFEKGVKSNYPDAMANLAYYYLHRKGYLVTPMDEAIALYEKAAAMGCVRAMYGLGDLYDYGPRRDYHNKRKARTWYQKAAEAGHLNAQFRLGMMYKDGVGVRQNSETAKIWLEKAASRKHRDAQYHLGMMHYEGEGIPKNVEIAKELFGLACDNGNEKGCSMYAKINTKLR